ncbi:MAG: hypothetical protein ACYS99_14740 [Planctomycetota bacterium]
MGLTPLGRLRRSRTARNPGLAVPEVERGATVRGLVPPVERTAPEPLLGAPVRRRTPPPARGAVVPVARGATVPPEREVPRKPLLLETPGRDGLLGVGRVEPTRPEDARPGEDLRGVARVPTEPERGALVRAGARRVDPPRTGVLRTDPLRTGVLRTDPLREGVRRASPLRAGVLRAGLDLAGELRVGALRTDLPELLPEENPEERSFVRFREPLAKPTSGRRRRASPAMTVMAVLMGALPR